MEVALSEPIIFIVRLTLSLDDIVAFPSLKPQRVGYRYQYEQGKSNRVVETSTAPCNTPAGLIFGHTIFSENRFKNYLRAQYWLLRILSLDFLNFYLPRNWRWLMMRSAERDLREICAFSARWWWCGRIFPPRRGREVRYFYNFPSPPTKFNSNPPVWAKHINSVFDN